MGNVQYLSVFIVPLWVAICNSEVKKYVSISESLSNKYLNHKWMKKIEDNKLLSAVSIPGTHQSKKYSKSTPKFQAWGLHNQLDAGIRFFELHVSSNSIKYVKSGSVRESETLIYVLKTLLTFLGKRKKETLLLRVNPDEGAVAQVRKVLSNNNLPLWRDKEIPTMGQVRGKIILIQSSTLELGLPVHITELDADMDTKEKQMRQNIKLASEKCEHELMLTYTGAKGESEEALDIAKTLNKQVDDYLLDLKRDTNRPHCVGIIAMDFPGPKVIQTIINFNGKLGEGSNKVSDIGSNEDAALPDSIHNIFENEIEVSSSDEQHQAQKEENQSAGEEHPSEDGEPPPSENESAGEEHLPEDGEPPPSENESAGEEHPSEEGEPPPSENESADEEHPSEEGEPPPSENESAGEEHLSEEGEPPPSENESAGEEHLSEEGEPPPSENESAGEEHLSEDGEPPPSENESAGEEHPSEEGEAPPSENESAGEEHPSEEGEPPRSENEPPGEEHPSEEGEPPRSENEPPGEEHPAEEGEPPPSENESQSSDDKQAEQHELNESSSSMAATTTVSRKKIIIKIHCHKVHARPQPSPVLN